MKHYILILRSVEENVQQHINHYCASCKSVESAEWKRALVNVKEGIVFCEWEAEDEEDILKGIREVGIKEDYEIVEVESIEPCEYCYSIFGEVD
ncbi:MAG: DUF4242 domain-containing protein [Halobacteriota archaeon]|nr:DUF4242 domain-containing protein [Halobacteriota archaeon]